MITYENITYQDTGKGLTRTVQQLGREGLLLFTGPLRRTEPLANHAVIVNNPSYAETRQQSTSGIWFGDMTAGANGADVFTRPVAVKPLGPAWKAVEEVRTAQAINRLATDDFTDMAAMPVTFQPIGIARTGDTFSVVTNFEQTVISFDNSLQRRDGILTSPEEAITGLAYAAAALIFLHANKFSQGDYQVKNTASDGVSSRVIDVTSIKKHGAIHSANVEKFLEDIRTYVHSVQSHHATNGITREMMNNEFIEYYRSCVPDIFPAELRDHVLYRIDSIVNSAYN